jgi:aspartate--ammonia ligase
MEDTMMRDRLIIPEGYNAQLTLLETEVAIKQIKDFFEHNLSKKLDLLRVSAPLFVQPETGLNDDLNGTERAVAFDVLDMNRAEAQIVHSLAKWKRLALERYKVKVNKGIYTDMNAIRRDEVMDNLHSIYVDQWDWEKIITKEDRTEETLNDIVETIYTVFKETEHYITGLYPDLTAFLPEEITYISAQELEDLYPDFTSQEREHIICKDKKAVFISKIGGLMISGERHDGRAPDYDDWSLNGDIVFWNPILDRSFELSSMGIRVSEESLMTQLELAGCLDRQNKPFHKMILNKELPYTVGGGIGQSRICMFFLQKAHIGEVQASIWPEEMKTICSENGIDLL